MRSLLRLRSSPPSPDTCARLASETLDALQQLDKRNVRFVGADALLDEGCALFVNGEQLDKGGRLKLLGELRGGAAPPVIEVEAVTYLQRKDTPNRKYVRFEASILSSFAKSFVGQPFLRDHNSYELAARGGTIVASKLETLDDGTKQIRMRLQLVKDWSIEGVLDGTIDRFSIGWSRTDIVKCSEHKGQVFRDCDCMPGQKLANGHVVEFIFTGAEGTEVSAVNVPAVVGTGIQAISQLDALDRAALTDILAGDTNPTKDKNMIDPQILAALGLAATATLADVLAAIASRNDQLTIALNAKQSLSTELSTLRTEADKREKADKAVVVGAALAQLTHAGKIKPGSETEAALRRTADRSMDVFAATVKDMLETGAQITPVGTELPAGGKDPVLAAPVAGAVLDGKQFLSARPGVASWLQRAGITQEQFEKHGARAREMIATVGA